MYIGVDIGGTSIKSGLIINGKVIKSTRQKTQANKGKATVIKNILKTIEPLFSSNVKAIGMGCPGPLDINKGTIGKTPNLPLNNVNLVKIIKNKFKVPTFLDNDANCFLLAEYTYGKAKGATNALGITIGTGVGGAIIINKKLYHGKNNAGELGHMTIDYNGPRSKCNNHGCLETHISKRGIEKLARDLKVKGPKEIQDLAEKGNKKAIKVYNQVGKYLGIALANLINAFDPDIIVLGGKISEAYKFYSKEMNKEIKQRALSKAKIVTKKIDEPGILGAAALCLKTSH